MISLELSERPVASIVILTQNNLPLLADCLTSIASSIESSVVPYEVIVVFNGTRSETTTTFLKSVRGIRPLRMPLNLGFGGGNNLAARHANGKYLVFLNDDTITQPGWLEMLVGAAQARADVGAVGSRLLFLDGTLQEAGGIIWSNGSTRPLGRGEPPGSLAYTYVRPADYVSANGLLVRRESFERLGGFDARFFPAYYEDTDLCLGIRHVLGQEILYEPRSVIRHVEAASTKDDDFRTFLFRRNEAALVSKWEDVLATYSTPEPRSPIACELAVLRRRGYPVRVLVVDDKLPDVGKGAGGLGSGFVRARELFDELDHPGIAVAFCPTDPFYDVPGNTLAGLGVDVLPRDLAAHLALPEKEYDVVVISRPHNFRAFFEVIRSALPDATIIYDVEALYHKRLWIQAELATGSKEREEFEARAASKERLEETIARSVDRLVVISDEERNWLESLDGHAPIEFMRPLLSGIAMTHPDVSGRIDAVFVAGWLGGEDNPNIDALRWYVQEVLPHVRALLPGFRTIVTGKNPPTQVRALEADDVIISGFVESIADLYRSARLAIAPIRIGAGVKNKTMEALQYGVPVVATKVGAEGLGLRDGVEIDSTDDPAEFARRLVAIATDDRLWLARREALQEKVARWEREQLSWLGVIERSCNVSLSRELPPPVLVEEEKLPEVKPVLALPPPAILSNFATTTQVLVIDDLLPDAALGSGFGRTIELIEDLAGAGFEISFYLTNDRSPDRQGYAANLGVKLVTGDLHEHLERNRRAYDIVVISRPHNFQKCFSAITMLIPDALVVFDAEALYHRRLWIQARMETNLARKAALTDEASAMERLESEIARSVDRLVAISPEESTWLQGVSGHAPIDLMKPLASGISFTPAGLNSRSGALFAAGWLGGPESPNADALQWYCQEVMPHVESILPDFRLVVTGKNPPAAVQRNAGRNVVFSGFVASLGELYRSTRIAIAPIRIGAGVKIKVMEALQHGVPVVATTVGGEGLGLENGLEIDIADDPAEFARHMVTLATDPHVWMNRRTTIARTVADWEAHRKSWREVMEGALQSWQRRRAAWS